MPDAPNPPAAAVHGLRAERLDAVRGLAIVWMVAFHFAFDLNFFGWLGPPQDFYRDPFWTLQRVAIVSLFLLCAGAGQALAMADGQPWRRFWRRWLQVAGCALLVSAGSALVFPRSWISFGVLHAIALMLVLTRWLAPRLSTSTLLALALAALLLPWVWQHPWFDQRWTGWMGFATRRPVTEDYVPLLPWLGVFWLGVALGRWGLGAAGRAAEAVASHAPARPRRQPSARPGPAPGGLYGPLPRTLAPLAALGRWPLTVYMLHQPLLIGSLWALQTWR